MSARAPKAAEKSESAPTLPSGVTKASGVTISTGVPRPPRQVTPDLGVTQQRESISRPNHNSTGEQSKVLVALREAGVADWRIELYGGVGHSFTNPDIDGLGLGDAFRYDRRADERAWASATALLSERFGAT